METTSRPTGTTAAKALHLLVLLAALAAGQLCTAKEHHPTCTVQTSRIS